MQIVITKAGKVIVVSVLIAIGFFFLMGGATIISKIVENHRVNSIDSVPEKFDESNLSYNNYTTLKSSFSDLHTHISKKIEILNKLKEKYPNNVELENKIKNYNNYFESMNNACFNCPEHINSSTKKWSETCSKCKGKGKKFFLTCKKCQGKGKIDHQEDITKACSYCGTVYPSQISAKSLLQ